MKKRIQRALERAGVHFNARAYEQARIEYQNVRHGAPDHIEANERMALRGDVEGAKTTLQRAVLRDPKSVDARLAMAARLEKLLAKRPGDERAAAIAAQFHGQRNDFARARGVYEKLLAAKPNAPVALNNLAALLDEKLNQSDRALEMARKGRQLEPSSPVIADTLGWILFRRKEYPAGCGAPRRGRQRPREQPGGAVSRRHGPAGAG